MARPVSVIELVGYRRRAEGLLTREEQEAVVDLIAFDPTCGDLIPGTGGLRKVRIGREGIGRRGGARVIYFSTIRECRSICWRSTPRTKRTT